MMRSAVRLCAQPGCTAPLSVSAPFRFCIKHRKTPAPLAQKRLTHSSPKPTPARQTKESAAKPNEEYAQDTTTTNGHQVNRTKNITKQGIDLLTRKIVRKRANKTNTAE